MKDMRPRSEEITIDVQLPSSERVGFIAGQDTTEIRRIDSQVWEFWDNGNKGHYIGEIEEPEEYYINWGRLWIWAFWLVTVVFIVVALWGVDWIAHWFIHHMKTQSHSKNTGNAGDVVMVAIIVSLIIVVRKFLAWLFGSNREH